MAASVRTGGGPAAEPLEIALPDGASLRAEYFAAVNYGTVPAKSSELDGVCPVVASYGSKDRVVGAGMARRLERHLSGLGVAHDVKTYDGAGHSFFSRVDGWQGWLARVPTPMAVGYDDAAAEDGWRRMLAFFADHVA